MNNNLFLAAEILQLYIFDLLHVTCYSSHVDRKDLCHRRAINGPLVVYSYITDCQVIGFGRRKAGNAIDNGIYLCCDDSNDRREIL